MRILRRKTSLDEREDELSSSPGDVGKRYAWDVDRAIVRNKSGRRYRDRTIAVSVAFAFL